MGLAQLQQWGRAQLLHDRVRVSSSSPSDLLRPDVNIVHVRRCAPVHPRHVAQQAQQLGVGYRAQVVADTERPAPAAQRLTQDLAPGEVREWLEEDVAELIGVFGQQLGYGRVGAKLEVLASTPCPRFHADHVGVRLLVSYCGMGTQYVPNRSARRRWVWGGSGGVAVEWADEAAAVSAAACDLLLLKGHAAPGNYGMGAVHRSPHVGPDDPPRLLLTVDDVLRPEGRGGGCGCGVAHGAEGHGQQGGQQGEGLGEGEGGGLGGGDDHRADASVGGARAGGSGGRGRGAGRGGGHSLGERLRDVVASR